ncbi:helix-turn-helix domain-containing protein [Paenibacillus agaridevorans]|uniref:helix-turn-helix domain-containing protein n=1 Tax=Paenibacillus agaridevorans TaxID=171404 RepID=UPI001BE49667|nr:AraC family transcriptional regulator [Paenibacillus agaridevorans]
MTYFPDYLKNYPNMNTSSPLHISLNTLHSGFRAHRHDFLEFSYVVDGSGSESINEVLHPMKPGTFTFVLPYQVHQIYTDPGSRLVLYNCMFSMDLLMESSPNERLLGLIDAVGAPPFAQLEGEDRERIGSLIEGMYGEYKSNEPWRQTMLQIRLKELLIRFDRHRRSLTENSQSGDRIQLDRRAYGRHSSVWPIIHYIHQHYQDDLTLGDLAARFNMSLSRISEVIKETTGQNFLYFLHDLRIRHACSLLVSTEMSVSEIALEVGYGSYNTFSRVFRETKGVVPKEYRKRK